MASNLEKMIKFSRERKAADFKKVFTGELMTRMSDKLGGMKQSLAKSIFNEPVAETTPEETAEK
tara:strand:+ start:19 stop:210 length:192 start_codon:yes stop_codon:yes gene_type:complete